jgi:hypothetical protein
MDVGSMQIPHHFIQGTGASRDLDIRGVLEPIPWGCRGMTVLESHCPALHCVTGWGCGCDSHSLPNATPLCWHSHTVYAHMLLLMGIWVISLPSHPGTGVWIQSLHLKLLHRPFMSWVFLRYSQNSLILSHYLPGLALNHNLPDLCLLSS